MSYCYLYKLSFQLGEPTKNWNIYQISGFQKQIMLKKETNHASDQFNIDILLVIGFDH